jgi:hypothetical protein
VLILEETGSRVVGENLVKEALYDEESLCSSFFSIKIVLINHGFMGFRGITYPNLRSNNSRTHIQERTI